MERLLILVLLFISCIETGETVTSSRGTKFEIVEIDSCEYLMSRDGSHVAHKGNCKYCKQRLDENNNKTRN